MGFAIERIVRPNSKPNKNDAREYAILTIFNTIAFSSFGIHGLWTQNRSEMWIFLFAMIVLAIYTIYGFIYGFATHGKSVATGNLIARFISSIVALGVNISLSLISTLNSKEYRMTSRYEVIGASVEKEKLYLDYQAFLACLSADIIFCINLVFISVSYFGHSGADVAWDVVVTMTEIILISSGWILIRYENRWITSLISIALFALLAVLEPVYISWLIITNIQSGRLHSNLTWAAVFYLNSLSAVIFRLVVGVYAYNCCKNFGQGLKEAFAEQVPLLKGKNVVADSDPGGIVN